MTWRAMVRRRIPRWAVDAVRWYRRQGFRYKKHRESPTDYLTEYDHRSLRRAEGGNLLDDSRGGAPPRTIELLAGLPLGRARGMAIHYDDARGRVRPALAASVHA